ncbi:MAG: 2-amino-4-hydroxy-6-hydroxymethyldihydropteridine diphosphokinase [Chloroflexota bacterium]|nr:2-amino-4-hydroxy-6-hydroxymethyldihydropteridine diphosphokinase [Chloroflexota bacterium]
MSPLHRAFVGLGSNVGDRRGHLRAALDALAGRGVAVERVSSLYETDPVGYAGQSRFLNAVAQVCTELRPMDLLRLLKGLERELGRTETFRNGPREIDLDLLLYDDLSYDSAELTLPHPRMQERAFVQLPLAELREGAAGTASGVDRVEDQGWWSR